MNADLAKAQNNLLIKTVNLRKLEVDVSDDTFPDTLDFEHIERQSYKGLESVKEFELVKEDDEAEDSFWNYKFNYAIGIRLIDPDTKPSEDDSEETSKLHVLLEIEAAFEADYVSKNALTEEEVHAFSQNNVGYHVWPYWRELVQSTCNRLGMKTPLDIPTYKIERKDK